MRGKGLNCRSRRDPQCCTRFRTPKAVFAQIRRGFSCNMTTFTMSPASRAPAAEPLPAMQQEIARLAGTPEVRSAMEWFRVQEAQFTRWQLEVARIAAPPLGEGARSAWLAPRLLAPGLGNVYKASVGNVFRHRSAA